MSFGNAPENPIKDPNVMMYKYVMMKLCLFLKMTACSKIFVFTLDGTKK